MYKYADRRNKRSNPARLSSLYFCSETERVSRESTPNGTRHVKSQPGIFSIAIYF